MTIGERIKYLRIEKNLSQDDLAAMVGYTNRTTIAKIESGQRELRQSKIADFAKALGVSPMYLLGLEENENSAPQDKRKVLIQKIERLLSQLSEENLNNAVQYLAFLINSQDK